MQTFETHGEYGQRQRGFTASQFVYDEGDGIWYVVDYVVENLDDVLGNYEVTDVRVVRDIYGMGTISFEPAIGGQFVTASRLFGFQMTKMVQQVLS